MDEVAAFFGSAIACVIGLAIIGAIVAALVYLVRKTQEEEAAAKAELAQIVNSLPSDKQSGFFIHYNSQRKNPTTAVVLALLLGGLGAHKFYLGQMGLGILYLVFSWTGIPSIVAFIEAFTISRTTIQMNRRIAREAMALLSGDIAALLR